MAELVTQQIPGSNTELREALTAAELPIDDLLEGGRRFFRFSLDGRTVGFGGFEPHGQFALLRSIVVLPDARGHSIGNAIVIELMTRARAGGSGEAFVLTTTAADYFKRLGFALLDRKYAPKVIAQTRQAMTICATAALLQRPIP